MASLQQGYRPNQGQRTSASPSKASARTSVKSPLQRSTSKRRKSKHKKSNKLLRSIVLVVLLSVLAAGGALCYAAYDTVNSVEKQGTFYRGVRIDGYELYGSSPQQAYDFLLGQARNNLTNWSITLKYEDMSWSIDTDMLGMTTALETLVAEEVNAAFQVGRNASSSGLTGLLERYRTIQSLRDTPYELYTNNLQRDDSAINNLLENIKASIDTPAVDATLSFNPERQNPVIVTEEIYGRSVDLAELRAQVVSSINAMESCTITVKPQVVNPQYTAKDLSNQIVRLSSFSTKISTTSTNERNHNIELGCSAFHGKVIGAGQKVSFNTWTGKRSNENGYQDALEVVSGEYRMGTGGGICQVSSTLYNACIQAGLEIISRTNHGLAVNYCEMGEDATVSDRGIDFVFRNNTGSDIYLVSRLVSSGGGKYCLFEIYGRPDPNNHTYELAHEIVEVLPIPEVTPIPDRNAEYVTYTDQTKTVSKGTEGYIVRTYLITKNSSGSVINSEELYVDTYKAIAPVTYVGVTQR